MDAASEELKSSLPECVSNTGDEQKCLAWTSCIVALAHFFQSSSLALGIHCGPRNVKTRVAEILQQDWIPINGLHSKKVYYIAGFILRTIENLASRATEGVASVLKSIKDNAVSSNQDAKRDCLPTQMTEDKDQVSLVYVKGRFYKVIVRIESVFHNLLSDESFARYGPSMVDDICHVLSTGSNGFS